VIAAPRCHLREESSAAGQGGGGTVALLILQYWFLKAVHRILRNAEFPYIFPLDRCSLTGTFADPGWSSRLIFPCPRFVIVFTCRSEAADDQNHPEDHDYASP
jgi:hypothetical protein